MKGRTAWVLVVGLVLGWIIAQLTSMFGLGVFPSSSGHGYPASNIDVMADNAGGCRASFKNPDHKTPGRGVLVTKTDDGVVWVIDNKDCVIDPKSPWTMKFKRSGSPSPGHFPLPGDCVQDVPVPAAHRHVPADCTPPDRTVTRVYDYDVELCSPSGTCATIDPELDVKRR